MIIGIEASHANKIHRTGVEWYCYHVINELKKIIPADTRVVLYTNEPLRDDLKDLPANWEEKVLRWPLRKLWSQTRLAYELWRNPPDVFFAPGQLIPWLCPRNTVATLHDSAFMADPKSYWWASRWYLRWMNNLIIKKAKKIILTADFNLRELKKYYGDGVGQKCAIVPLAYDDKLYNLSNAQTSAPEVLEKYQISRPYIISISRLEEKKNTARIVESFDLLKRDFPSLQLVLIGKPGVGYEKVKESIEASANRVSIITPGYVENAEMPKLLGSAEVFVFPSLYEGFGIPILEAMACGVPVVASDNTALPEVGAQAAIYIDPNDIGAITDAIRRVLYDPELRQRLVLLGIQRIKNFSWELTARQVVDVIYKLYGSKS